MNKIILFGFPHCGTTILRSIIGHIDEVHEIVNETRTIKINSNKKFVLCKYPYTKEDFFSDKYNTYIKIFIIRNPLYVFSSLNRRFENKIPVNLCIDEYIYTLRFFIKYKKYPSDNIYVIRYEDLFNDNYINLRNIFDKIGFIYDDTIFDNSKFHNKIQNCNLNIIPDELPKDSDHHRFRYYQINQPFINNNDTSKISITNEQLDQLQKSKYVLSVYPEIINYKL